MDLKTACFLKNYCRNIIKWWYVVYNPEAVRIWPSQFEKEEALRLEAIEQEEQLKLETDEENEMLGLHTEDDDIVLLEASDMGNENDIPDDAYNATTGSYSGLYGQKPVDEETQKALELIMGINNQQNTVDFFLSDSTLDKKSSDIIIPEEQDEIIREANIIYQRLLDEAEEDEAKKRAEIEQTLRLAENGTVE